MMIKLQVFCFLAVAVALTSTVEGDTALSSARSLYSALFCRRCHQYASCKKVFKILGVCKCNPGFYGNGRVCQPLCHPPCHLTYGYCGVKNYRPYCYCNKGYIGNGRNCKKDKCYQNRCHRYADCIPRKRKPGYTCRCKPGYQGDGYNCRADPCRNNNCHKNAVCIPNPYGFDCRCKPGFVGNGRKCRRRDPCANHNCHQYARCIPKNKGFSCKCRKGYWGSGRVCYANNSCKNRCHDYRRGFPCQCNSRCYYARKKKDRCCKDYRKVCY